MFKTLHKSWKTDFSKHIIAISIFLFCVIGFLLFDLLTKYFLFDIETAGKKDTWQDYKLFGIRSFPHYNSTIFSSFNLQLSARARITLNFSIVSFFLIPVIYLKTKFSAVAFAILFAGVLGNSLDNLFSFQEGSYVRDILYLPWMDRGTFNVADMFIIIGSILFTGSMIASIFKKDSQDSPIKKQIKVSKKTKK